MTSSKEILARKRVTKVVHSLEKKKQQKQNTERNGPVIVYSAVRLNLLRTIGDSTWQVTGKKGVGFSRRVCGAVGLLDKIFDFNYDCIQKGGHN